MPCCLDQGGWQQVSNPTDALHLTVSACASDRQRSRVRLSQATRLLGGAPASPVVSQSTGSLTAAQQLPAPAACCDAAAAARLHFLLMPHAVTPPHTAPHRATPHPTHPQCCRSEVSWRRPQWTRCARRCPRQQQLVGTCWCSCRVWLRSGARSGCCRRRGSYAVLGSLCSSCMEGWHPSSRTRSSGGYRGSGRFGGQAICCSTLTPFFVKPSRAGERCVFACRSSSSMGHSASVLWIYCFGTETSAWLSSVCAHATAATADPGAAISRAVWCCRPRSPSHPSPSTA